MKNGNELLADQYSAQSSEVSTVEADTIRAVKEHLHIYFAYIISFQGKQE